MRGGCPKRDRGGSHLLPVFNNNSYPGSSTGFVILMMPLIEHLRAIRAQSDNCITIGRSTVSVGCQITGGMMIGLSVRDHSYCTMGRLLFIYLLIMGAVWFKVLLHLNTPCIKRLYDMTGIKQSPQKSDKEFKLIITSHDLMIQHEW